MSLYYHAAHIAVRILLHGISSLRVEGGENVPRKGGLLVAANHCSFWDPVIVGGALPREAFFLAKEELFANPAFGLVLRNVNAIPIRRGVGDLRGLSRVLKILKQGRALVMFPEGGRMRDGELHAARPGVGMLAVHADASVLPCYVSGSSRPSQWLVRRRPVSVTFGRAEDWRAMAGEAAEWPRGRPLYQAIGDVVMERIAELKAQHDREAAARGQARQRQA